MLHRCQSQPTEEQLVMPLQDVHASMPLDQESDSEGSSVENLGDVTQFGLTGALAQMANLTFMAGAPGKSTFFYF